MIELSLWRKRRLLEPIDRISEILFGLIMVLTVTCTFSVVEANGQNLRNILVAALGCNLAWGAVDAVFYLLQRYGEQGRGIVALKALRKTSDKQRARHIIASALPSFFTSVFSSAEFESIHQRLNELPDPPRRPQLTKHDWLAALGIFLLVFLSTFPVVIPFLLLRDPKWALRASNGVAVVLLFFCGYALGRYAGRRRWLTGVVMVFLGVVLVGIAIILGG